MKNETEIPANTMSERADHIVKSSGLRLGGLRFKRVMRWDRDLKMLRIARVMWEGKSKLGNEIGNKLSLALWPKLFSFEATYAEFDITILGVRVHKVSGGGRYA